LSIPKMQHLLFILVGTAIVPSCQLFNLLTSQLCKFTLDFFLISAK
jgi:hypothetical protein